MEVGSESLIGAGSRLEEGYHRFLTSTFLLFASLIRHKPQASYYCLLALLIVYLVRRLGIAISTAARMRKASRSAT